MEKVVITPSRPPNTIDLTRSLPVPPWFSATCATTASALGFGGESGGRERAVSVGAAMTLIREFCHDHWRITEFRVDSAGSAPGRRSKKASTQVSIRRNRHEIL